MNIKKRKVVLLTKYNLKQIITEILKGTNYDFLILLYFDKDNDANLKLLISLYNYFNNKEKNFFLKNVVIISTKEYLANDLKVKAIINPKDIQNFNYDSFVTLYENSNMLLENFIENCAIEFNYQYDLYDMEDPWIYTQNNTNILSLTEESHDKILYNYHKIKETLPDIILSVFKKSDNAKLIKMLKLIGADAHIIFTFINDFTVEYSKRSDVFIYIEDENFEKIGKNFINDIFYYTEYPEGINLLRNFLGIPEKNFEADMTYDEEREINKKTQKYYSLELKKGTSLKNTVEIKEDTLFFNLGLNKLYILSKCNI